jgi:DNA repair exonuclease SbcCD ATPase subunit
MFSPDDTDYNTSIGPIDRSARAANRRVIINEKRHRNTDMLPKINGEMPNGKTSARQVAQLREENKRLRWELDEHRHLIYRYRQRQAQLEQELDAIHRDNQKVIEQYEIQLREAIDECNQLYEANQELERRYQKLDYTFHETVTEEASKMVEEAAHTLVLSPEYTPPLLRDVAKTLEFQVKQTEDLHVAELLSLMRQAQHKAELLEQELANEREKIAAERQNLLVQQAKISEQAKYRYDTMQQHLRARWTLVLTLMAAALLVLVPIFQLVFVSWKVPLDIAIFAPVLICIGAAFLFARAYTNNRLQEANKKLHQNTTPTSTKTTTPTPAAKKA